MVKLYSQGNELEKTDVVDGHAGEQLDQDTPLISYKALILMYFAVLKTTVSICYFNTKYHFCKSYRELFLCKNLKPQGCFHQLNKRKDLNKINQLALVLVNGFFQLK